MTCCRSLLSIWTTLVVLASCGGQAGPPPALPEPTRLFDPADRSFEVVGSTTWDRAVLLHDSWPYARSLELGGGATAGSPPTFDLPRRPASATFSPDESLIAFSVRGTVRPHRRARVLVSRVEDGMPLFERSVGGLLDRSRRRFALRRGQEEHGSARAHFSTNGSHLITGPHSPSGTCRFPFEIIDTHRWSRGRARRVCLAAAGDEITLSADARWLAEGAASHLTVYDLEGEDVPRPRRIRGVESVLNIVASPDGEWLAAETWEGIKLVHVSTGRVHHQCELRPRSTRASPHDRQWVATPTLGHFDVRPAVAFAQDQPSATFVAASEHLCWFDLHEDGTVLFTQQELDFPALHAHFAENAGELALLQRFVDGYVLTLLERSTGRMRHSTRSPFLRAGRPQWRESAGWQACGIECAGGLRLRCGREDLPLLEGGCALECRGVGVGVSLNVPAHRCVTPNVDSLLPQLNELATDENAIIRQRAALHLHRMAPPPPPSPSERTNGEMHESVEGSGETPSSPILQDGDGADELESVEIDHER